MGLPSVSNYSGLSTWNLRSTRAATMMGGLGGFVILTAIVFLTLQSLHVSMGSFMERFTSNYLYTINGMHLSLIAGGVISSIALGIIISNKRKTIKLIDALKNSKDRIEIGLEIKEKKGKIAAPATFEKTSIWLAYEHRAGVSTHFHYFYDKEDRERFLKK